MKDNNYGSIILTSIGLSNETVFKKMSKICKNNQVVTIIVTASEGKKNNKYVKLAVSQFKKIGVKSINLVDIEFNENVPNDTTILYVSGGNTFDLLFQSKKNKFKNTIKKVLNKNGFYIGVSAGSIILGKSIEDSLHLGDVNKLGLKNFKGLEIINYKIFPHYNDEQFKKIIKKEDSILIKNNQAFLIKYHNNPLNKGNYIK